MAVWNETSASSALTSRSGAMRVVITRGPHVNGIRSRRLIENPKVAAAIGTARRDLGSVPLEFDRGISNRQTALSIENSARNGRPAGGRCGNRYHQKCQ